MHNASHSDAILTNSLQNAEKFINSAGSAAVYVNASTRFTDGAQFGTGAEVAVSTQKLHARGPMGWMSSLPISGWVRLITSAAADPCGIEGVTDKKALRRLFSACTKEAQAGPCNNVRTFPSGSLKCASIPPQG